MSELDRAKTVADSYIDEISGTVEIRRTYNDIIVAHAGQLYGAFAGDKWARTKLDAALKLTGVDPSTSYKPLIVQLNGVFENYIRSVVKAVIEERFEKAETYFALEQGFRNTHVTHAAKVLSFIKSGTVMGAAYNFEVLLKNLGLSLSGHKDFKLSHEVFTKLMGNCTPSRLTELFESLDLPTPFSNALGENAQLCKHFKDNAKGRVASNAERVLKAQIDLRNDIVHGELTRAVDLAELQESISFFSALISGLDELVRA
jgi:hypothetical protein